MPKVGLFKTGELEITFVDYPENTSEFLEKAQAHIGGWLTSVTLTRDPNMSGLNMYLDDEGLLKQSPISIINNAGGQAYYVGPVIFTRYNGMGETIDLTDEDVKLLKGLTIELDMSPQYQHKLIFKKGDFK